MTRQVQYPVEQTGGLRQALLMFRLHLTTQLDLAGLSDTHDSSWVFEEQ
jgi:hypothetical protein